MLCDNCRERDAVVHLTQIVANAVTQLHLCEKCAAERGVETSVAAPKHPLGEFLQAVQQQLVPSSAEAGRCPFCNSTMRDFRATGRWGCARCYTTFEASMRDLLRRVHGSSRHAGRPYQPPRTETTIRGSQLGELREQLRRAIESEQFELAADLRDRIRVLE
jgi:protein arginine kinase activator